MRQGRFANIQSGDHIEANVHKIGRLALLGGPDTWLLHEFRDGLRISQWKAAAARRQDMQGPSTDHGVDRLASLALMRQRKTAPRDKARLQSLLSGSLRLQERLHVAKK